MPYCKPRPVPFAKMRRLLLSYELDATRLSEVLGVCYNTAKRKLDSPVGITLGDIDRINRIGHIPMEEIREAVAR